MSKVDPNDPTTGFSMDEPSKAWSGIPIRLHIATQILAGMKVPTDFTRKSAVDISETALYFADKLIELHNKDCEGE